MTFFEHFPKFSSLQDSVLNLLFPRKCVFCRKVLPSAGDIICPECSKLLKPADFSDRCQVFEGIDYCFSPFYYEDPVRQALRDYKFHGRQANAYPFAKLILDYIGKENLKADIITWVPLSRKRLRKRGYDQAKLLAEELAAAFSAKPLRTLVKVRNVHPQSLTGDAEARKKNIENAYRIKNPDLVKGKTILIVDDIVTTGATLSECCRLLKSAGASEITAVTVARAKPQENLKQNYAGI